MLYKEIPNHLLLEYQFSLAQQRKEPAIGGKLIMNSGESYTVTNIISSGQYEVIKSKDNPKGLKIYLDAGDPNIQSFRMPNSSNLN